MYGQNIISCFLTGAGSVYIVKTGGIVRYKKADKTIHDNPKNIYYADTQLREKAFIDLQATCSYYIIQTIDATWMQSNFYDKNGINIGYCNLLRNPVIGATTIDFLAASDGRCDPNNNNDAFHFGHAIVQIFS